ncbi:MAG: hypothetical protein IJL17_12900 [Kiritimatiellae bacterium]|nr:hypothetical protein [Kiritimatiellia bacterium]
MRRFLATIVFAVPFLALCEVVIDFGTPSTDTTNTVLMVDQRGNLNVEGVASVENVASNSAKVAIAEQKAQIARDTATAVSNSIDAVVQNLMVNNEVIYRSGFSDSFAPLVVFTDSDILAVVDARWTERSAARLVCEIDYVCTINLGAMKPTVMHRETIGGPRTDFAALADANVTAPVYHAEQREYSGQTFAGYYSVTATIPNPSSSTTYFLWIKCEADAPSGDGATLDLPNGVTGGRSVTVELGNRTLTWVGGVLMEVE